MRKAHAPPFVRLLKENTFPNFSSTFHVRNSHLEIREHINAWTAIVARP